MRNRAKCKVCFSIIESFHVHDYVTCSCGEISIDGGQNYFKCSAKSWDNFLRIDDNNNEIVPIIKESEDTYQNDNQNDRPTTEIEKKPTRQEQIDMLDHMIKTFESLPSHAMTTPVNQYDFLSLMLLISSILKSE